MNSIIGVGYRTEDPVPVSVWGEAGPRESLSLTQSQGLTLPLPEVGVGGVVCCCGRPVCVIASPAFPRTLDFSFKTQSELS